VVVDTYAVQHPGVPERRSIQSVAVHLVSLCAVLERGWPPGPDLLRRALRRPAGSRWLDHEQPIGANTVADVVTAEDPVERARRAWGWARDVWGAWEPHHPVIRAWVDAVVGPWDGSDDQHPKRPSRGPGPRPLTGRPQA
jgi:hypothetical protein